MLEDGCFKEKNKSAQRKIDYCNPNPCNNGTCSEIADGYVCNCSTGFNGVNCSELVQCSPNTCINGKCSESADIYVCNCSTGFKGAKCDEIDHCNPNPCNNGKCSEIADGYVCNCSTGSKGVNCSEIDQCSPNPCNNGKCSEIAEGFVCNCSTGLKGVNCDEIDHCNPNPCNNGTCSENADGYVCKCPIGFIGAKCDELVQCSPNNCINGKCLEIPEGYVCNCSTGFKGPSCDKIDHCNPNPCNNGKCSEIAEGYVCNCSTGFKGVNCSEIDHCNPNPCDNGKCSDIAEGFVCNCSTGFKGVKCSEIDHCDPNPCDNGECSEIADSYVCNCSTGFKGVNCDAIDHCNPNPCNNGKCSEIAEGFVCNCSTGFKGVNCSEIDNCSPNPCNDGKCSEIADGYVCNCSTGFKGVNCDAIDQCSPNPCNNGKCSEIAEGFVCNCSTGFKGVNCDEIDQCSPNPCNNGKCSEIAEGFVCNCSTGFKGVDCSEIDQCTPNPCNNGQCSEIADSYVCKCSTGFKGVNCTQIDHCNPNPCNNGTCLESADGYFCNCSTGFIGPKCDELVQCSPNNCINGKCLEIPEGYVCNCSTGFKGPSCDTIDQCTPNPCNNGQCSEIADGYVCNCSTGFKGVNCDEIDHCDPNPCNNGTCSEIADAYVCKCPKGLRGTKCDEIDHCHPNPCNNGTCSESADGYVCKCPIGFRGAKCDKIDHCNPNPCDNGTCSEITDGYVCNCSMGFKGAKCDEIDYCNPNPCNNGTCSEIADGYVCKCPIGLKGAKCDEIDHCSPNPCNNGKCLGIPDGHVCQCSLGFKGAKCDEIDHCNPSPCMNGRCLGIPEGYICKCFMGFKGAKCDEIDYCCSKPCQHGTCSEVAGGYVCNCTTGFTGVNCDREDGHPYKCGFEDNCRNDFKIDATSPNLKWAVVEMDRVRAYDRTEPFGHYMYAEIKQNNKKNEYTSFNHNFTVQKPEQCLEFYYHMYNRDGCDVGRLQVTLKCEGSDQSEILMRETGGDYNNWTQVQIPIKKTAGSKCKLTWRVSKGLSDEGKVHIDEVSMHYSPCRSDEEPRYPSEADCSFYQNTCHWKVDGKLPWEYSSAITKTRDTGPYRYFPGVHSPNTAGMYTYVSAKERTARWQKVSLESPTIKSPVEQCMRYVYNMHGKHLGSLEVTTAGVNQSTKQVLRKSGDQGKEWREGWIDLPAGKDTKVKMVATIGFGELSDIALASIKTSPGKCKRWVRDCSTMKCAITDEDCGEEIREFRKEVVGIRRPNHLTTIPKLSKEWEVSLDIMLVSQYRGWSSIFKMTATDKHCCRRGDNIPAILLYPNQNRLQITNVVGRNDNYRYNDIHIQKDEFTNVKLGQRKEGDKYYFYIYNNGSLVKKEWNQNPTQWENVKMYASGRFYDYARVRVKNLVFKNTGDFNYCNQICNKNLLDSAFTSLKPDPPRTFNISSTGYKVSKGKLLGTIPVMTKEWSVSVEIKPLGTISGFGSILHFTANNRDCCYPGDRIPGIYMHSRSTKMYISTQIYTNGNRYHRVYPESPLNQYTKVVIKQEKIGGKYQYTIDIDNKTVYTVENIRPTLWKNVKVYAANPWHSAANVEIRNLVVKNLVINQPCPGICKSRQTEVKIEGRTVKGVSLLYEECLNRAFVYQVTVPKNVRTPRLTCLQFYYKVGFPLLPLHCLFYVRYQGRQLLFLRPRNPNKWEKAEVTIKHYFPYGYTNQVGIFGTMNERCTDVHLAGLQLVDGICENDLKGPSI